MTSKELSRLRFDLRWLLGAPMVSGACLAGIAATLIMGRATSALEESGRLHLAMQAAAVRVAAEQAAAAFVRSGGEAAAQSFNVGAGINLATRVEADESMRRGKVLVHASEQVFVFDFPVLPGGGPQMLASPLSALESGPELPAGWQVPTRHEACAWPRLQLDAATRVTDSSIGLGLRRDQGIALLRLQFGTEREDFLLGAGSGNLRIDTLEARFVHIHGNLWVDKGSVPLTIELDHSLTMVVEGNVYLGRSIEVVGEGELTIVTRCGDGVAFVDRDGDGRWSAGEQLLGDAESVAAIEGQGSVYVGLPGAPTARVECELGLVVEGELHVGAERVVVHGPVALAHGATSIAGQAGQLVATGKRLPDLQRQQLPGFAVHGRPRPGRLFMDREQTLYRAAPTR